MGSLERDFVSQQIVDIVLEIMVGSGEFHRFGKTEIIATQLTLRELAERLGIYEDVRLPIARAANAYISMYTEGEVNVDEDKP